MSKEHLLPSLNLFVRSARVDVHAKRCQGSRGWRYEPVIAPLTEQDLLRHLESEPQLGAYLIERESSRIRLAAFDLDDHGGDGAWEVMCETAIRVAATARRFGLNAWPVRSGGGHGIHLFFRWDQYQEAHDVRLLMATILAAEGFNNGTAGIAAGDIEIFPKQNRISDSEDGPGYGALIALPFGRESVPLDLEMYTIDTPIQWPSSQPAERNFSDEEKSDLVDEVNDYDTIAEALKHIDNGTLSYEDWIRVGFAIKGCLGEEGKSLFASFSKGYADNTDKIIEQKWRSFKKLGSRAGTLFKLARQGGWKGRPNESPAGSDLWIASQFIEDYGRGLRYTAQWSKWNVWNGNYWKEDNTLKVYDMARETVRKIAIRANKKQTLIASAKTINAVAVIAKADRKVAATIDQWDLNPWLLGTAGGTVDLRSGSILKNNMDDHITKIAITAPGGECPIWRDVLHKITAGDVDLQDYLQIIAGYSLTGSVREEALFFFYGGGGNGKGTFIETLGYLIGDYGTTVAMSTLMASKNTEHPTEIAKLRGVRLAMASETKEGARWDVAKIKLLTGGDQLTGRFMRGDYFDFMPSHKLIVSGNRRPMLGTVDAAIARRMHLVPFLVQISTPDRTIKERLRNEAAGILAWAVEGCLRWQRHGLVMPDVVAKATEEYLHDQDDIQVWIDESCQLSNSDEVVSHLYDSFGEWCDRSGAFRPSKKEFTQRLAARGFEMKRSHGITKVRGLILGQPMPDENFPDDDEIPF